jgi:hypothetical protein
MSDLKRHAIELVKDVKEGEIVKETYLTPAFLPMKVVYEAIEVYAEIEKNETSEGTNPKKEIELYTRVMNFVANEVYGKQFTPDDIFNGLHAPDVNKVLFDQVLFVARGVQNDFTKKYLAKKR